MLAHSVFASTFVVSFGITSHA